MNCIQMVLVTNLRVELHPDFIAELIAGWRAGWGLLQNQSEIALRAGLLNDEGFDIPEAIEAAKQQICTDAVRSVCTRFWTEFRIANSLKSKAGSKPNPPSTPSTPSP